MPVAGGAAVHGPDRQQAIHLGGDVRAAQVQVRSHPVVLPREPLHQQPERDPVRLLLGGVTQTNSSYCVGSRTQPVAAVQNATSASYAEGGTSRQTWVTRLR